MNQVEGVIFDFAGTTIDFGCFAPVHVFVRIFKNADIEITIEEGVRLQQRKTSAYILG